MVTLNDVAQLAGVSPATASRVINATPYSVAEALRERVLAAVAELHYVPNAHAQALARANNATVGVIVHDVSDPYFAEITRGLQRVATEHGRLAMVCNSYREPEREVAYIQLLRAQRVEAIVLAGSGYRDDAMTRAIDDQLSLFADQGGRVAVIGRHELSGDAVMPDNYSGAYALASMLYERGHVDLGVVSGPDVLTTTEDRLNGIRRAARMYRRRLPADRVVDGEFTRDAAVTATHLLLDAHPGLTAIVALNDAMAVGVLAALRERDVRVPQDISVAGFDDMPIARDVTPPLTTVRLPMIEMGARALTLALGPRADAPRTERVPVEVIERASTGPPPPRSPAA
jgi:LacI family transcriptional regulator